MAVPLRLILFTLALAAFIVTWLSARRTWRTRWSYVFVAYTFVMFLNVWVPHVSASIWLRAYTPGVVTAVLLNLPITTFLLVSAFRERQIPRFSIATLVFGIPLSIAVVVALLFPAALEHQ